MPSMDTSFCKGLYLFPAASLTKFHTRSDTEGRTSATKASAGSGDAPALPLLASGDSWLPLMFLGLEMHHPAPCLHCPMAVVPGVFLLLRLFSSWKDLSRRARPTPV